jgi:cysteine synthase
VFVTLHCSTVSILRHGVLYLQTQNGTGKISAQGNCVMIIESPLDLIFRDLFYRVRGYAGGNDLFLKLEGFNITGSIKMKTAQGLIADLEQRGLAKRGVTTIVESSSGNLGIALALVCAIKGYKFICVTDANATRANIRGMKLYGAKVIVVDVRDADGGFLKTRSRAFPNGCVRSTRRSRSSRSIRSVR